MATKTVQLRNAKTIDIPHKNHAKASVDKKFIFLTLVKANTRSTTGSCYT